MKTITIRVFEQDCEQWKDQAKLRGLSISEWIRRQCNEPNGRRLVSTELSQPERAGRNNGSASTENLSGVPETPVSGRRVGISERRATRRGGSRVRKIEDVAHTGFRNRKPSVRNILPASGVDAAGRETPSTIVGAPTAAIATRDNFAELMAHVPKDELDVWARSLPTDILPRHSATSNRHTCLCSFCLTWRKANYIPYGGPVKKEKR